jgi:hypothetical protein
MLKAFAEQVDWCEMNHTFGKDTFNLCGWCFGGLEIHHVMGGPHRIDAAWNLVRLCQASHRWVTEHPIEGQILCWWILHQRGAFDVRAIFEATGVNPIGKIGARQSEIRLPWVADLAGVLLGVSE